MATHAGPSGPPTPANELIASRIVRVAFIAISLGLAIKLRNGWLVAGFGAALVYAPVIALARSGAALPDWLTYTADMLESSGPIFVAIGLYMGYRERKRDRPLAEALRQAADRGKA